MPNIISLLKKYDALRDADDIETGTVDRLEPRYAPDDVFRKIDDRLAKRLAVNGITQLYRHQSEAIELALAGSNVVLEAPTASGKTLAFGIPVLHDLMQSRNGHAMLIYPMNAVALDQREKLLPIHDGMTDKGGWPIESWTYNGDVDAETRKVLRTNPTHLLITNIDYIHRSFLAHANLWTKFLENLRWVVLDEIHEYRGYFGTNAAMVLRRLGHFLASRNVHPQFMLATATCANPKEHAENLTGQDFNLVSATNQFQPKRDYVFVDLDPQISEFNHWRALQIRAVNAALALGSEGKSALVFCPTRQFAEQAYRMTCDRIRQTNEKADLDASDGTDVQILDEDEIQVFKGGMNADDRRSILSGLNTGDIKIVYSTNALELGVDIRGLDAVVMAGFPANMMSARQQIGRAGRGWDRDGLVVYLARNNPWDRFYARNLEAFLEKDLDEIVVDSNNEVLSKRHATCVFYETGSIEGGSSVLGEGIYNSAMDLLSNGAKPAKRGGYSPHHSMDLRGASGEIHELMIGETSLGTISGYQKFKEAYDRAIILQGGKSYRVVGYNVDMSSNGGVSRKIELQPEETTHQTRPYILRQLYENDVYSGAKTDDEFEMFHGNVSVYEAVQGIAEFDQSDNEIDRWDVTMSENSFSSSGHAFWVTVADDEVAPASLRRLENIFRVGSRFVIPADEHDTYTLTKPENGSVYVIESYSGGIGIARKIFEKWVQVLNKGLAIAQSCTDCTLGCPYCILPPRRSEEIDKVGGIRLANALVSIGDDKVSYEFAHGMWHPVS